MASTFGHSTEIVESSDTRVILLRKVDDVKYFVEFKFPLLEQFFKYQAVTGNRSGNVAAQSISPEAPTHAGWRSSGDLFFLSTSVQLTRLGMIPSKRADWSI
jgi:hypothetical protein